MTQQDDRLTGRVALVTGGSRGIGRAIALALAGAGARVAVGYRRDEASASEVVNAIVDGGGQSIAIKGDVSDPDEASALVRDATAAIGPVGILVNNAGINPGKPFDQLTNADWDLTIRSNLSSAFYVTQAAVPAMRAARWGRIIMLSSVAAQTGGVIGPHYAASKAGMIGLTHSYANLLAKEGVTANAISPALIETDMLKGNDKIKPTLIPIGRFGRADEVAAIALLLATNGYITGQTINANGGWYMS
jgi:3-oxoacyl-[acyl-carrier protein] reductase